jgi:hypothetical protein
MRPTLAMDYQTPLRPTVKRRPKSSIFSRVRWARVVGLVATLAAWPAILFVVSRFL